MWLCVYPLCCCYNAGELFDHGLDSWACILLPLTLFSAIGTGTKYGGHTDEMIVPCIGVLSLCKCCELPSDKEISCVAVVATFYLTHWEKYITGVLYLPWLYDVSQLVMPHLVLCMLY